MDSLTASLLEHGVPLVGLNVFLQQLGLPIPAVPTMIVAGAMAAAARLSGAGVFAISVAASVIADLLWFWAGRRYGYRVLKFLCRVSLSPDTCVRQTEGIFERYGFFSVVVSKFVPGFSTVAPPIAGALDMSFPAFVAAAFASAALWVGAAMGAGWIFSSQVDYVLAWMSDNAVLAAGLVGALLASYIVYKAWQRWRLARFVAASRITVDELASMLDEGSRCTWSTSARSSRTATGRTFPARSCSTSTRSTSAPPISRTTATSCSIARARTRSRRGARRSC